MSLDFTQATLAARRDTEKPSENLFDRQLRDGDGWGWSLTFVLADLLDPRQRVDLHQRVRHADHVHHVHHTLHKDND